MSNVINKLINLWLCVIFYGFMIWWRKIYIIEFFRVFSQIRDHDVLIFNQENICKLLRSFCFPEKIRKMSLAMKNGLHWHLEKVDFSNVKDTYGTGCTNSDFQENLHKKLAIAIPNWYLFFAQKRTIVQVAFQKWNLWWFIGPCKILEVIFKPQCGYSAIFKNYVKSIQSNQVVFATLITYLSRCMHQN